MLNRAQKRILITGYSLSEYFSDMIERINQKSQQGVFVKFYVNNIESQKCFDRLLKYQGRYLQIYNYPKQQDSMSALHAKVISIDQQETLITSANLSYHGQEGNVELGAHIISKEIAIQVEQLFTQLIFSKVFEKYLPWLHLNYNPLSHASRVIICYSLNYLLLTTRFISSNPEKK